MWANTQRDGRPAEHRWQRRCFQCRTVPLRSDIKGTELPPANILIQLERLVTDGRTDGQTDRQIALQLCR